MEPLNARIGMYYHNPSPEGQKLNEVHAMGTGIWCSAGSYRHLTHAELSAQGTSLAPSLSISPLTLPRNKHKIHLAF